MISIIICSRIGELSVQFIQNIENTISVVHEIIVIDNSEGKYSISEAYNEGIKKSNYSILCFIHEDILFHTKGWGQILISYFKSVKDVGCIGVAGATIETRSPSGWYAKNDLINTRNIINIIQHTSSKKKIVEERGWLSEEKFKEVVVLDGVFLAFEKRDGMEYDLGLPAFHCYDINISLEAKLRGLKNIVTREILIEHFSLGTINKDWIKSTHYLHKKYRNYLPIEVENESVSKLDDIKNFEEFVFLALNNGDKFIAVYYWSKFILLKPISKVHLKILKRLIF